MHGDCTMNRKPEQMHPARKGSYPVYLRKLLTTSWLMSKHNQITPLSSGSYCEPVETLNWHLQLLLSVLKSGADLLSLNQGLESKWLEHSSELEFWWKLAGKEQKSATSTCSSVILNMCLSLAAMQMCKKASNSPQTMFCHQLGYSAVLNAIQSIFSYINQVLSTMHHTAVTSYSFVCSSFFSKQLLTTSIWPKVASKGCGAKLCKKVCQAPLQMTTSSSPLLKVLKRLPHDITMQCVSFNNITIFPIDL
jgi:hypothetical protein